jgi:hypothetical protein
VLKKGWILSRKFQNLEIGSCFEAWLVLRKVLGIMFGPWNVLVEVKVGPFRFLKLMSNGQLIVLRTDWMVRTIDHCQKMIERY